MKFDEYLPFIKDYNNKYMNKDNSYYLIKLSEEVGEVAEAGLAALGSNSKIDKIRNKGMTPKEALEEELGDVLNVLLTVGQSFGITSEEIFKAAASKIVTRISKKEKNYV